MNELPVTRLMFAVAANEAEWIGTHTDLVMNSLRELYRYDAIHYTQILSRLVREHRSVYGDRLTGPFTDIRHVRLIRLVWWEWHLAKGTEPSNILPMFVRSLCRSYPVVLSLPANLHKDGPLDQ